MLNIYFAHYEAFGGPIINNAVGSIINAFTVATNGFLTDVSSLILAYFVINIMAMIYVLVKSLDAKQAMLFVVDPEKPYINIITKGIVLAAVFTLFLKPIPVLQMTPVIGYNVSSSTSSVNKDDRVLAGWLINDMKTTTGYHSSAEVPTDTNYIEERPLKTHNEANEMLYVPQIFWLLGLFEDFYYGFPNIDLSQTVSQEYSTTDDDGKQLPYFKFTPTASVPTILNCIPSTDTEQRKELLAMESGIYARINLGELTPDCKANLEISDSSTTNIWHQDAKGSLSAMLFGLNTVGEGLSDFFEPIDRFFYYLSTSFISELISDRIRIAMPIEHVNSRIVASEKSNDAITANALEYASDIVFDDYDEKTDNNIRQIFDTIQEINSPLAGLNAKDFVAIINDIILNQEFPPSGAWRKNTKAQDDDSAQARIDSEVPTKYLAETIVITPSQPIQEEVDFFKTKLKDTYEINIPTLNSDFSKSYYSLPDFDDDDSLIAFSDNLQSVANELHGSGITVAVDAVSLTLAPVTTPSSPTFQEFSLDQQEKNLATNLIKNNTQQFRINKYLFAQQAKLAYTAYLKDYLMGIKTLFQFNLCTDYVIASEIQTCIDAWFADEPRASVQFGDYDKQQAVAGFFKSSFYDSVAGDNKHLDKTITAYISIKDFLAHSEFNGSDLTAHVGEYASAPLLFKDVFPDSFWTATPGSTNLNVANISHILSFLENPTVFTASIPGLLASYLQSETGEQDNNWMLTPGVNKIPFATFSNWSGNEAKDTKIKGYFDTALTKVYANIGATFVSSSEDSGENITFDTAFSAVPPTENPKLSNFSQFTSHTSTTTLPPLNGDLSLDIARVNTYKYMISQIIESNYNSQMSYIIKFNNILISLKNLLTDVGCGSDTGTISSDADAGATSSGCKVVFDSSPGTESIQDVLYSKISALAEKLTEIEPNSELLTTGVLPSSGQVGVVELISRYIELTQAAFLAQAAKSPIDIVSNTENKKITISTKKNPKTCTKRNQGNAAKKCKARKDALSASIEATEANSKIVFQAEETQFSQPIYNIDISKPFNISPAAEVFSYSSWSVSGTWNWIITTIWDLYSIPLDILRELQNTASIKVSASSLSQSPLYQPQFVIGSYVVPQFHTTTLNQTHQNYTQSYSNRSAPKQFRLNSSRDDIKSAIDYAWYEPFLFGYSLDDIMSFSGAIVAVVLLLVSSTIFAFIFAIISALLKLILYVLRPTAMIVFLGIIAGIIGFIRATIIAPIAFALSFIATDFSRGFSNLEHIGAFQHIFQNSQALNFKTQFTIAFKQLSVWLLSVTMIFALLWIDNMILSHWQESALIKAWLGDLTGKSWMMISGYFVIAITTLLYGLLITKAYEYIQEWMTEQTLNDPLLLKVGQMLKEQTKLSEKITDKIT